MEKQSSGLTPSLPGEARVALGRHSLHWLGARSSSGGSPFQGEEGELGWEERSPGLAMTQEPRPRSVDGLFIHSFSGFLTFPVLSLPVSLRTQGGRTTKLTTCFHFGFLIHLQRRFLNPRLMPLNNKQTSIGTSKQHLNIFC